jgi:hypothetical protein
VSELAVSRWEGRGGAEQVHGMAWDGGIEQEGTPSGYAELSRMSRTSVAGQAGLPGRGWGGGGGYPENGWALENVGVASSASKGR